MSERFQVKPPELLGYAEQVQRNAGFVRTAQGYLSGPGSNTSEMEGLLSGIADGYKPLVAWQLDILQKMSNGLESTVGALHKAAELYESSDKSARVKIDKVYPANEPGTAPPK